MIQNEEAVQSFEMTDVKLVTIQVDKVIHGKEIVWAHGNPVFTFRLQGTDLDGDPVSGAQVIPELGQA